MSIQYDYLIVGAGIVGAATAYALSRRYPAATIGVLEKEAAAACHQSGHNSGVIHAGIYYAPDSFKAKLCRAGLQATYQFAAEHDIATIQTGKLLVATDSGEIVRLKALARRARENGAVVDDVSRSELAQVEPHIRGLGALRVRDTGIVDYAEMTRKLLKASGAESLFGFRVFRDSRTDERRHRLE